MIDLTAIVLTKNESKNISDCLKSIQGFAKRVVVVDSGSTDGTVAIAESLGADVYVHKFENYARQFNWGIDNTNITTKWTLRLDADERFTTELCNELDQLTKQHDNDDVNGITMEAWLYFLGKCIQHGGSKKRKLMVFKTGIGRIEDRKMDEHTVLSEGQSILQIEDSLEIIELKQAFDDKVLISIISTACLTPKMIFGEEPYVILLYKLFENNDTRWTCIDNFMKCVQKLYCQNKFFIPLNIEELKELLGKIKKELDN